MSLPDYYEILQISQHADTETVSRVFRLLAKRLHPDNATTGNPDRFGELLEAFRVLSNPESRAAYDVQYEATRQNRWRIVDFAINDDGSGDARLRDAILSILYQARRQSVTQPGVGNVELENLLGCSEDQIRFHLWYLKEKGWMQRLDNGLLAITIAGVDRVMERGTPARSARDVLAPGESARPAAAATGYEAGGAHQNAG